MIESSPKKLDLDKIPKKLPCGLMKFNKYKPMNPINEENMNALLMLSLPIGKGLIDVLVMSLS